MNMLRKIYFTLCAITLCGLLLVTLETAGAAENISAKGKAAKVRFMVVSSYHPEYIWSQETNSGVSAALLDFGYLDNKGQIAEYTKNDYVESARAIVKKEWMDTKRQDSKSEIAQSLSRIVKVIDDFKPDIILLGDDNAANYIGNYYLDTPIPIVFWGINGLPIKYSLLDSLEHPGHNVTGVYQLGYHAEAVEYLKKIVPGLKTIAVLSDDSPTGRAHAKRIQRYAAEGSFPVQVEEIVVTNSFAQWQAKALALQKKVDGFYISTHNTLKDEKGVGVDYLVVAAWHLKNIKKPEVTPANFLVIEGFLCTVDDSAFNQGYEATKMAHLILAEGISPAEIPALYPSRGPFIVNRKRAKMLGLEASIEENKDIIDQYVDEMVALDKQP
ncbi:MAG: hypothetical protein KKB30_07800 [Proteobacteria bacterium]|nr:hypothetical protein [Pseudomonadota bacterium]MBU1716020.1 hypothetical protein [Pseudomonadota bacterium]